MEVKFFREYNAEYMRGECEVIVPSEKELHYHLRRKFKEKLKMIDVIFDKTIRKNYFKNKNISLSNKISEKQIRKKIALRVIVDYLDLIYALSKLNNLKLIMTNFESDEVVNECKIKILFSKAVNKLVNRNNIDEPIINEVLYCVNMLIKFVGLDIDDIEHERINIETKEGSFLNGKIIIYNKNTK